jgi:tetratricopeptide (TPR) repeat protein
MDILTTLSQSDELYRRRGEPGAVKQSVKLLAARPDTIVQYEPQWRLARALFFLGQQAPSAGARRQLHAAAIGAGERAAALGPDRVEGHFWLGVNLALFAECSGPMRAVRAILKAKGSLARAARISAEYHDAGPLRVLGRLKHKAPWFLGGSLKRSRQYFDRALETAPANSVTLVYAAELALDAGERERAIELLERVLASPIDPNWEFENRRDRSLARELLARFSRA